jgi:acyl-CoA dehydrogenase
LTPEAHDSETLIKELAAAADERIAPNASDVDRNARFPQEGLDVLREHKLLSASLPEELGGMGLPPTVLTRIASTLASRCASTAMVWAMHEAQIECMRFATVGNAHFEALLKEHAEKQLLIASVTSEAGIGGNIRASNTVAAAGAERVIFEKQSPTLSYGEQADAFLITARRSDAAAESDQVLVYAKKEEVELEKLGEWDMMGMRGTCSPPFKIAVDVPESQLIDVNFGVIAAHRMVPWSHLLWASCWEGVAADAFDKAVKMTRKKARKKLATGGEIGDPRLADAYNELQSLRGLIYEFGRIYEEQALAVKSWEDAEQAKVLTADAMSLKLNASMLSSRVAEIALEIIGMPGYSESAPMSVTRNIRDLFSARLMVSNERLRQTSGELLLLGGDV